MDVAGMAVDTLSEWLNGYFTPETGPQLRVRVHEVDGASVTVGVEQCDPFPDKLRTFRITVTAEETT
jgi:hypothetical protein